MLITKAPCGGQKAGRSPVDRGKQGIKRSTVVDGRGIPLGAAAAPADRHDSPLLEQTLDTLGVLGALPKRMSVHLDRAYDSRTTREKLKDRGLLPAICEKGKPAPLAATKRWVVERTNSWQNAHKKLVWCTERRDRVIDFWVAFSETVIIVRRLIREGWSRYRWEVPQVPPPSRGGTVEPDAWNTGGETTSGELVEFLEHPPAWFREQAEECVRKGSPDRLVNPLASVVSAELYGSPYRWREVLPAVRESLREGVRR